MKKALCIYYQVISENYARVGVDHVTFDSKRLLAAAFIFNSTKLNEKYKRTEPREGGETEDESNVAQCDLPTPPVSSTRLKPYQDLTCLYH
ncbi:hypothetical protein E2C01_044232 [Portunus trituberculatus]|uniref:Uncharacterized protein n=1 Tax=Portunus trituberculatus TaxID=210409 RepID=A0A5B7G1R0_PORTR|nr:hypothetical protein [Portunus trituberculatus]